MVCFKKQKNKTKTNLYYKVKLQTARHWRSIISESATQKVESSNFSLLDVYSGTFCHALKNKLHYFMLPLKCFFDDLPWHFSKGCYKQSRVSHPPQKN